ncbi:nuclear hormone receptor FTZ-F1-like isoform X3 [Varroa jacobsoni]|uniref:Nuclear hormone receptor FTZ-F1 n=1 Tax=Varroa destructor TaxID=109461 RepID=A0A7M7M3D9_VARDE|nr:nuclear hormone receptor FTZ-F1-like isoform X5 [Varroa destructor]XP_022688368.1 nuclear hormone receptor FTZ-F1-like isoform X3 [Varroa jacobsoni]
MLAVAGGEQANSPDSLMPPPHTNNSSTNQNNSLGRQDQQKSTTNTTSTTTAPTTTTTLTLKNGASCDSEKTNSSTASASQGPNQYSADTYQPPVNVMAVSGVAGVTGVSVAPPPGAVVGHANPSLELAVISPTNSAALVTSADSKEGIEELCPVCGDKVSGYHYGLLTCESCKGFFKRTVQNKKVYTCVADRSCHIDKSQRKRCPFCRFQKCLDVGMKLEAVRADRMRGGRNKFGPMYKRDRARKLQMLRQKQLALQCADSMSPSTLVSIATNPYPIPTASVSSPGMYDTNGGGTGGVKQEIQIPQLSSSTSSPDSSPSPLQTTTTTTSLSGLTNTTVAGTGGGSGGGGGAKQNLVPFQNFESGLSSSQSPLPLVLTSQAPSPQSKIPHLVRELQKNMTDDKEWQSQLFQLLQSQTYNQCEVDLFELMCKVIDQALFAQVDWARSTIFFKELRVDDQMKLLQQSWSDMLILDHLHQRMHHSLPDEAVLPNGQKFDLVSLCLLGVPAMADQLNTVTHKLLDLRFDQIDFACLKFLMLLNPDPSSAEVRSLSNTRLVTEAQEQTKQVLLDYCTSNYPSVTDKFGQLMAILPEIKSMSMRGEEFLFFKHVNGNAPTQTLLMEMLHAKRKA